MRSKVVWASMLLMVVALYFVLQKLVVSAASNGMIDSSNPNYFAERAQMRSIFTAVGVVLFAIAMLIRGGAAKFGKYVVRLAILEMAALVGFVYALQFAHDPAAYLPFMGVSILGLLISFPRS